MEFSEEFSIYSWQAPHFKEVKTSMLNRRSFLKQSALALVAGTTMPLVFRRGVAVAAERGILAPSPRRVLIIVQLKGGNDGLNTIVPHTDGTYYDLRGELALTPDQLIPLNDELGFHPNLSAIAPLWDSGDLAIVQGTGYPYPSYSHFVAMNYWEQSRTPDGGKGLIGSGGGWLGKYLEQLDPATIGAVPAMNIGSKLAPELASRKVPISTVRSLNNYQLQKDNRYRAISETRLDTLHALYKTPNSNPDMDQLFGGAFQAALDGSIAVQEAHAAYTPAVTYPDTNLAEDLLLLAEGIHFNQDLKVGHVAIGGFDTHANQLAEHGALLLEFSEAVAAFWADIAAHGHQDEVVIMTWSEFGRRPDSNASGGTDHGSAGPTFLFGNQVIGGLYGEPASLTDLDKKNLKFTTDFRSVYATVLEKWLGAPAEEILGGRYPTIPVLA